MEKNKTLKEKYQDSDFHWLILIFVSLFIVLVMLSLLLTKYHSSTTSETVLTTLQKQTEKEEELRSAYGDIGTVASTKNFEFTVNKVNCTQVFLASSPQAAKITSKRGKFCLIGLTVKNISDETQIFTSGQVLLNTYRSVGWQSVNVQYRSNSELEKLFSSQYGDIEPGSLAEGQLIFDVPAEVAPYVINIVDIAVEVPARIYLDDNSSDYSFECRQPKSVEVGQIINDCAYEHTFKSLDCKQTFVINDQTGRVCLATFSMKNISHQFRDDSPYAPNITYQSVYKGFWNHDLYLVDNEGNRYGEFWGRYLSHEDEDGEYQSIELLPDQALDYHAGRYRDIAPGQSVDNMIVFILPTGVAPASIDLDKPFFTYDYIFSPSLNSEDSSPSSATADSAVESNRDPEAPGGPSGCPTCGLRSQ